MEKATIPGPPALPIVGNARDVESELPIKSLMHLAATYGPIFQLWLGGNRVLFIGSQSLMNEISNEKRFSKSVSTNLKQVRNGVRDGVFTAYGPEEKNWGIAHRILMPVFGPTSIRGMFDEMHDIASQLVMKWARHGSTTPIPVSDDFTKLTLDTLALCTMDFRFNSYYREELHPFIDAMGNFLTVSGNRARRPPFAHFLYRSEEQKYFLDIELLRKTSREVIQNRREHPSNRKDLLNALLNGEDPQTGEKLQDNSVIDNMITFLIAGHETTSGLLSFTFYNFLKHPEVYQKAQKEVDDVVGREPIRVEHLSKLPYISAVLRETLRLTPSAPSITLKPNEDTTLGGQFPISKAQTIVAVLPAVHRDPLVYGEDADEFRPERMLDEPFDQRNKQFPNCWKPFGNGMRGCIGRPFAWQEALLVTAMLLQHFNFSLDDTSYQLQLKQTLTIKPKGFYMRAYLRHGVTPTALEHSLASLSVDASAKVVPDKSHVTEAPSSGKAKPMAIYYGSNTGTCEALAQRLATDAPSHGFAADLVATLDSAKENLPTDKPVVLLAASYEGQPTDNAAHFFNWLESLKGSELGNVSYSVFGCGHHDWSNTFLRIPRLIDELVEKRGGKRIATIGTADAASGDIFDDFEAWEDNVFWPAMRNHYGAEVDSASSSYDFGIQVTTSSPRSSALRQDVYEAQVYETTVLSAPGAPEKRHIEIGLPSDMTYSAGDYLAVLPLNPKESVDRAMRYFGLAWDSMLTISSTGPTTLPTNTAISAADVFRAYVELAQPASKRNISCLISATNDGPTKTELTRLATSAFTEEISNKRVAVLDLLERFPSIHLPIGSFLQMQPPMRVRQYSISSSPLWNHNRATLTYAVLNQPALSGQGRFVGVASNYLSSLSSGDRLHVSVRPSHQAFHLPNDSQNVPIICIAAGTGIAPFRAFIQERAAQIAAGRNLAPALLFFGCHSADTDDLYAKQFARWEAIGAVSVRRAYSRAPEQTDGAKYVQDRVWQDRKEVVELFNQGAKVFVCGSKEVGLAVSETCIRIVIEKRKDEEGKAIEYEEAKGWFEGLRNERFATDVFA